MKRFIMTGTMILTTLTLAVGCVTTPITKRFSSSSPAAAEAGTYSQVPASMRADVKEAEFDLKQAEKSVKLAEEQVKLAELKKDRAILADKSAELKKKHADIVLRKAELVVEIRKAEAIDNSGLGSKEDNIKTIADLKTKELGIQSDQVKTKADIDTTDLKIRELDKQIRAQADLVQRLGESGVKTSKADTKTTAAKKKKK